MTKLLDKICKARDLVTSKDYDKLKFYNVQISNLEEEIHRQIVKNSNNLPCTDFYADCENCKDEITDNGERCMKKGLKEIRSFVERV